jgi:predicted RNA polymerase sigma factor
MTRFHLEAGIAYWHTIKEDSEEKWENVLQLYNELLFIEYSPIAALNRTYALSKANGKTQAIAEAEKINLTDNHLYHSLLGELYNGVDNQKALAHLEKALQLTNSAGDRSIISRKIALLKK